MARPSDKSTIKATGGTAKASKGTPNKSFSVSNGKSSKTLTSLTSPDKMSFGQKVSLAGYGGKGKKHSGKSGKC